MKYHTQFLTWSTGYIKGTIPPQFSKDHVKPIEACGGESVYVHDGRHAMHTMHHISRQVCKKRGYIGYIIKRGQRFTESRNVTSEIMI